MGMFRISSIEVSQGLVPVILFLMPTSRRHQLGLNASSHDLAAGLPFVNGDVDETCNALSRSPFFGSSLLSWFALCRPIQSTQHGSSKMQLLLSVFIVPSEQ